MPLEIINQQNAKVFSREIMDISQKAKAFFTIKKIKTRGNLKEILIEFSI